MAVREVVPRYNAFQGIRAVARIKKMAVREVVPRYNAFQGIRAVARIKKMAVRRAVSPRNRERGIRAAARIITPRGSAHDGAGRDRVRFSVGRATRVPPNRTVNDE